MTNATVSETTASDHRAMGGGVIDTLAESNGAVLALRWGEAAKEHDGGVGVGWWREVEGGWARAAGFFLG